MRNTDIASAAAARNVDGIAVEVSRGSDALAQAEPFWQALEQAGGCPSPFQSWRWVRVWRRHFHAAEPLLLLARDADGAPLALLPLQQERVMGFMRLTWLTARGLQYGGMLLRPGLPAAQQQEVFEHLWAALLGQHADYLDLPLLPEDDALAGFLARRCDAGPENASFRIDFSEHEDWRAFELALKPSARRSRKKRLNKLKRAGELTFTVHDAGPEMTPALRQALEWKRGWLDAQGLHGALPYQPAFGTLLEELFGTAEKGAPCWKVAVLALDGKPIAVDAGKVCRNSFHAWFSAYDADYAEHSPGKIALWLMMQWCMDNGLAAYDMLANPAPYKEEWANQRQALAHFIRPLSLAGRAYALWLRHGEPLARNVYQSLPPGLKAIVRKPLMHLRAGK